MSPYHPGTCIDASMAITLNWRLIRPLLILFCITLLLFYIYTTFLPPGEVYNRLFDAEVQDSNKLIHNERSNKYVKFKQLQGAGFNNQVRPSLKPPKYPIQLTVLRHKKSSFFIILHYKHLASTFINLWYGVRVVRRLLYHYQHFYAVPHLALLAKPSSKKCVPQAKLSTLAL